MKVKGEMNNWKYRFFIGIVTAGLVLFCSSCVAAEPTEILAELEGTSYQPVPTNLPEISSIEDNAKIKFPPSAHEIYAYTTGLRDIYIMVRFSMNASEISEFMDSTLCDQPLAKPTALHQTGEDRFDWWVPDQAQYSEECFGEKEHSHQQIIIDMSDTDVYIIYVSTSTY